MTSSSTWWATLPRAVPREDAPAPPSLGQRLLWMMERRRGTPGALNMPMIHRIDGPLDREALTAAVDRVVRRHEALRTRYVSVSHRLSPRVLAPRPTPVPVERLGADGVEARVREAVTTPMDLGRGPLRAVLLDVEGIHHVLVLVVHHLSTDAWSQELIAREISQVYNAAVGDGALAPPEVTWQHRDFVAWQERRLTGERLTRMQDFWRTTMEGARAPSLAPVPEERSPIEQRVFDTEAIPLSDELWRRSADLGRNRRTSTFAVLLAAFAVLARHDDGGHDLTVRSMFANRARTEARTTVGYLANSVLLRLRLSDARTFADVLEVTRRTVYEVLRNQELPYHVVPGARRAPQAHLEDLLFQVVTGSPELDLAGTEVRRLLPPSGRGARFDLELTLGPGPAGSTISYASDRYDRSWARRFADRYAGLVRRVLADPSARLRVVNQNL
jgi:hypothetical protein